MRRVLEDLGPRLANLSKPFETDGLSVVSGLENGVFRRFFGRFRPEVGKLSEKFRLDRSFAPRRRLRADSGSDPGPIKGSYH